MMVRLRAQAEFSWEHQFLLQQKIRTVSQNARRAFPNVVLDVYVNITALL